MIFCKLPRAGLGNQLFLIAKSIIYAELNNLEIVYLAAQQIKIGPYLRNERSKRNYNGYFIFQNGYFLEFIKNYKFIKRFKNLLAEPKLVKNLQSRDVLFSKMPNHLLYFEDLIPFRELLKTKIFENLTLKIRNEINELKSIDVAVHIRLGDFQKINSDDEFGSISSARTPFAFFLTEMKNILMSNKNSQFIVFSDGYEKELADILNFPNTHFHKSKNDIVDMYQMSKSKILITSAGSTFSYWAGFLGDCEIIQHPDHTIKIK